MSDRLDELRRQRALVQEQLAWIEREINELSSTAPTAPAAPAAPATGMTEPPIPSSRTRPSLPSMVADPSARPPAHSRPKLTPSLSLPKPPPVVIKTPAEKLATEFDQFQVDAANAKRKARRGCLFYAAVVFLLLALGLVAIYFLRYRDHPLFGAGKPAAQSPGHP